MRSELPLSGLFLLALSLGCSSPNEPTSSGAAPVNEPDGSADGEPEPEDGEPAPEDGEPEPEDGDDQPTDEPTEDCGVLRAIVRDFTPAHPDFESAAFTATNATEAMMAVTGLVEERLGTDQKPVFRSTGTPRAQLTSAASFASWYNDTPGTNQAVEVELTLTKNAGGVWVYDNSAFFPVDGMALGNYAGFAGGLHNFHFTTEIHMTFPYEAGQTFTFRGDDDLWLFVAGKLAVDLGGLHLPLSKTLDMDTLALELGLVPGEEVKMDIFHAERHTEQSNFRIETNIQCLVVVL